MKHLLFCLTLFLTLNIFALTPQEAVYRFTHTPQLQNANISLIVKHVESGKTVMEHRANQMGIPASTTKLVTTATAIELLGKDFRFETPLQHDGSLSGTTLKGNLIILGGCDPTLGSRYMGDSTYLQQWVKAVKDAGVKRIEGDIVADASLLGKQGICPKWTWEDMGNYYGSATYALSVNDDICNVHFRTGAAGTQAVLTETEPRIEGLHIDCHVTAANSKSDDAYFYGAPFELQRYVTGTIPANRPDFVSKMDLPNPPLTLANLLKEALTQAGITVTGKTRVEWQATKNNTQRRTIYVVSSPTLEEIISEVNHRSNNHYAEHIYRYLGTRVSQKPDIYAGSECIKKFWTDKVSTDGLLQYDGCGLSPSDAISTKFFVDLLIWEKKKGKAFDAFYNSLPIAGENGTVKSLLKGTSLSGKVHCKSGSISGTQCYAGYMERSSGTYAFAIEVNHFHGSRAAVRQAIEQLLLSVK